MKKISFVQFFIGYITSPLNLLSKMERGLKPARKTLLQFGEGGRGDEVQKITIASLWIFLLMLFITGCAQIAPAQLPERLANQPDNRLPTLSAPFTITENTYQNEAFSVTYPKGWRVVSSASFAPPSAVFVSPDERQIILVSTEDNPSLIYPLDDVDYDEIQTQQGGMWIIGIAPVAEWEAFLQIYQVMIAGLDS